MKYEKELKEIEEMVRDYYPNDTASSESIQDSIAKGGYANIVALYDKGYRKIPEGAVVLSENEYYNLIDKNAKNCIKQMVLIGDAVDKSRKETAKEIFKKIHQKEGYYPLASVGTSQNDMAAIAKEYGIKYTPQGVEVEE